jgi:hypothetical protein
MKMKNTLQAIAAALGMTALTAEQNAVFGSIR